MHYVIAPNGVYASTVQTTGSVFWDANHFCPASALTPDEAEMFGVYPLLEVAQPVCGIAETVVEQNPTLVDGQWTQQWSVRPASEQEIEARNAKRVAGLWQAAHDLEYNAISGSAVGLLTMGVLQGKPKCVAVQAWIKDLWALYYQHKLGGSSDTDFSSVGECPHTVPDLMEELGF